MSVEIGAWLAAVTSALRHDAGLVGHELDDTRRRQVVDELGGAFAAYRSRVYDGGFTGVGSVSTAAIGELCEVATLHLDDTIRRNRRPDGLFHSYNLIEFSDDGSAAAVKHLHEMLEGQVAVLGAGVLTAPEQAEVVDALFGSDMYRSDQRSFMLYPARRPPSFMEKNLVDPDDVAGNPLLRSLVEAGDDAVLVLDADGRYRFSSDFTNAADLVAALDRLAGDPLWRDLVAEGRHSAVATYEKVFHHRAFTGRSGTMYGYEGIGSIYWHMVAKLLVAVQEAVVEARAAGEPAETVARLVDAYWRVRSGLGFNKTAVEYGAFPTDPYSHTPAHAGAQQPGMTGQVKEELLTRLLEVGVRVESGEILFDPVLLRADEFCDGAEGWPVIGVDGTSREIELSSGSLGLTLCQVPFVVTATPGDPGVEVVFTDGTKQRTAGLHIDRETSRAIFRRSGEIVRVTAAVPASIVALRRGLGD
jgi:hypothetical protein